MGFLFVFLSLFLFHGTAFAHDGSGLFVLAGSVGAVVAILVAIWSLVRGLATGKAAGKAFPIMLVNTVGAFFLIAVCYVAFYVLYGSISKSRTQEESAKNALSAAQKWQENPVRVAACAGDLPALGLALDQPTSDKESLSRVLEECAVKTVRPAVLKTILEHKLKVKLAGDQKDAGDHCAYLAPVMSGVNIALLEIFSEMNLSLTCNDYNSPMWWQGLGKTPGLPPDQVLTWLHYLQDHGVDLREHRGRASLLFNALRWQGAPLIHFALDLGMDPYAHPDPNDRGLSMLQHWIIRRFNPGTMANTAQLTAEEKASVQARLRELTAAEANLENGSTNGRFQEWDNLSDGGANLFAYLLKRGAVLRLSDSWGSMLDGYRITSPQLINILDKLSDDELRILSCPVAKIGKPQRSLYKDAKGGRNSGLVQFLDRRKVSHDCS